METHEILKEKIKLQKEIEQMLNEFCIKTRVTIDHMEIARINIGKIGEGDKYIYNVDIRTFL